MFLFLFFLPFHRQHWLQMNFKSIKFGFWSNYRIITDIKYEKADILIDINGLIYFIM